MRQGKAAPASKRSARRIVGQQLEPHLGRIPGQAPVAHPLVARAFQRPKDVLHRPSHLFDPGMAAARRRAQPGVVFVGSRS